MQTPSTGMCLFLAALSTACFKYVPVRVGDVPPGTDVRASLTDQGRDSLEQRTRMHFESISGKMVEVRDGRLYFDVPSARGNNQVGAAMNLRQRIDVPREDIIQMDRRELDKLKTGALLVGMTAGATTAIVVLLQGEPASGVLPPGGGPDESVRTPLIWLRYPVVIP